MTTETFTRRDPRVANAMNEQTRYIHRLLERWGDMARRGESNPLGLPAESWLHKWQKLGIDGAQQKGPPPTMPADIAAIDRAICDLDGELQAVVKAYYLRNDPPEALARRLRISVDTFNRRLGIARRELNGALKVCLRDQTGVKRR